MTAAEKQALELYETPVSLQPQVPKEMLQYGITAAKSLKDVISKKDRPVIFNGEQYLEMEDWETLGKFFNYAVKTLNPQPVEVFGVQGFKAEAIVTDTITGVQIGGAEAYCMRDEPTWGKKPMFQLASMAQTRAGAKAFRNLLSWVAVLAGYKPTPAEEMDGVTATTPPVQPANTPKCPKCQSPMNLKPAGTKKDGKKYPAFWSCSTYPNCKGTLKMEEAQKQTAPPTYADSEPEPTFDNREPGDEPIPF